MKTVADYLSDSRLLNDPAMSGALEPIREIHAARLMLQDEISGMDTAEKVAYINARGKDTLKRLGFKSKIANFSGQGKIKPKAKAAEK